LHESVVHGLPSSQLICVPPHAPFEQVSPVVQALLSLQLPVMFVCTQPVALLQESAVQELPSSQLTAVPVQVPPEHLSLVVHAVLSLHVSVLFV
jgi:hypothetical protein